MTSPPPSQESPTSRPSSWQFWIPLAIQTVLVLFVPIQAIALLIQGEPVILQTEPVDPYDLLRGYYVTLSYDISNLQRLEDLPGWDDIQAQWEDQDSWGREGQGISFYIVLEAPMTTTTPPTSWTPIAVRLTFPNDLSPHQVPLRGTYRGSRVVYDLERYYIPEEQRDRINRRIQTLQSATNDEEQVPFVVQVNVGNRGRAIPVGLWLEDEFYRF